MPVSMELHSIKKTNRDDPHVQTQPAATMTFQGVSLYEGITKGQHGAEVLMTMEA